MWWLLTTKHFILTHAILHSLSIFIIIRTEGRERYMRGRTFWHSVMGVLQFSLKSYHWVFMDDNWCVDHTYQMSTKPCVCFMHESTWFNFKYHVTLMPAKCLSGIQHLPVQKWKNSTIKLAVIQENLRIVTSNAESFEVLKIGRPLYLA
jgi:hypothetical protein